MAVEAKKRSHDESSSSKKHRSSGNDNNAEAGPSKTKPKSGPRAVPSFTSALKADEGDFPRGGGTGLTAFELKQVREEGKREAEAELAAEAGNRPTKKPKRQVSEREARRQKKNEVKEANDFDKDQIRAEHLTYKRLTVGTHVLARIHTVLPLHLILSLPNNLLAHVPITEISSTLTSLLSAEQAAMDVSDDEDGDGAEEDAKTAPELAQLFAPGAYYPARVIATYPTASQAFISQYPLSETTKLAARVEMTLMPEKVNEEIAKADLVKGFVLVGEVKEEEDKGWTVGLGLGDEAGGSKVGGWIAKDQMAKTSPGATLIPGQLVRTAITAITAGGRVMQLSPDQQTTAKAQLNEVSNVASVLPGHLVNALITAVMPSGLNVKIGGFYDGTIDLAHLDLGEEDVEEKYKVGKKIRARVLYDNLSVTPRRFGLSALPHILDMRSPLASDGKTPLEHAIPIGKTINSVKVTKVIPEWGLTCRTDDGLEGFVHVSHISDERLPALSSAAGPFSPGTLHRARVIGHSPLDGVVLLSLEQKVLDQVFMAVSELKIGQQLKGTIRRLTDKALFVDISGSVDGIVHPLHYADIRLKYPEKRFKVGGNVKARVLQLEPARGRVILTLKKTLVESEVDVKGRFDEYKQGDLAMGTVIKVLDKGVVAELFGGLKAFVPQSEASQTFTSNLSTAFYIGQPVQLRIIEARADGERLTGSIRQALPSALAAEKLDIGHSVSGQVTQIHAEQVVLTLQPSQVTAILSLSNLSNHRNMGIDELRASLKVGEKVDDLVIVSKNQKSGLYIVSHPRKPAVMPPNPVSANGNGNASGSGISAKSVSWKTIQVGQIFPGQVMGHHSLSANVQIGAIRGRLHACDVADDYSTVKFPHTEGPLEIGDRVDCAVVKVIHGSKLIELSARPSRLAASQLDKKVAKVQDPEISSAEDLKVGKPVRGFVKSIAGSGVFVALGRNVTARVMIKELFDDYVKEWQPKFTVGQLVSGKILKVDTKNNLVEMTFRTKPAAESNKKVAQLSLSDYIEGQVVVAVVKQVETYGVFLRIEGSSVTGLCHKSEVTDNKDADVASALKGFRTGDQVKAKIVTIDKAKNRVSFGLKASYFGTAVEAGEEDEEMDGSDEDAGDEVEGADDEDESVGPEDLLDLEGAESDEEAEVGDADEADDDDADEDEDEDEDDEEISIQVTQPSATAPHKSKAKASVPAAALDVAGGFDWTGTTAQEEDDASSASDSDEADEGTTPIAASTSAPGAKSKGKSRAPLDLTATAPDSRPESTADFERALLASPNSSFLWIQYMSFLLQLHEVDKARRIGRQALAKIAYREEEEKLNVWMALINLELGFGASDSAEKVFKEASQYNDAKTVWMRYVEALQVAGKDEMAEEAFKKVVKKFSAYPESWLAFATYYLKKGNTADARALLPRSLKSLDKPKHVEMIEKMAILEFKHGEAERGKTLLEGLLDRHKKRLDLWNVYIDQLARQGDIQGVRGLFDRALDQHLTSKKAKFLFKKWLAVEGRIGDSAGQDKAKERAKEWVTANIKVEEADEGDEEDEDEE